MLASRLNAHWRLSDHDEIAEPLRGADGDQPFCSLTIRTSAAAGPRRSRTSLGKKETSIMTAMRSFFVAAAIAVAVVVVSILEIQFAQEHVADRFRWVIFPGDMIDSVLSGNVHLGFGGVLGVIVMFLGNVVFYTIPLWAVVFLVCLPFRKGKNVA